MDFVLKFKVGAHVNKASGPWAGMAGLDLVREYTGEDVPAEAVDSTVRTLYIGTVEFKLSESEARALGDLFLHKNVVEVPLASWARGEDGEEYAINNGYFAGLFVRETVRQYIDDDGQERFEIVIEFDKQAFLREWIKHGAPVPWRPFISDEDREQAKYR